MVMAGARDAVWLTVVYPPKALPQALEVELAGASRGKLRPQVLHASIFGVLGLSEPEVRIRSQPRHGHLVVEDNGKTIQGNSGRLCAEGISRGQFELFLAFCSLFVEKSGLPGHPQESGTAPCVCASPRGCLKLSL